MSKSISHDGLRTLMIAAGCHHLDRLEEKMACYPDCRCGGHYLDNQDNAHTVTEKQLSVTGEPREMKLIAEALYEFAKTRGMDLPKTLNDWCYNAITNYQEVNDLQEEEWDFIQKDKEQLGLEEEIFG